MKGALKIVLPLLLILCLYEITDGQSRRPTTRTGRGSSRAPVEKESITDKLNYEIRIGNLGLFSGFAIDLKPSIGYKVTDFITLGAGYRGSYSYVNPFGFQGFSLFSHGPVLMGRIKAFRSFYLQGEYTLMNFQEAPNQSRFRRDYPAAGVGYVQGDGDWKFSLEGMIPFDDFARNYFNVVEVWINFSYNF